jgi:hypothetical protein
MEANINIIEKHAAVRAILWHHIPQITHEHTLATNKQGAKAHD